MARRKSRKSKTPRRTTKSINLFGVAEALLIGNAVTRGFFNADLNTFIRSPDGASTGNLGLTTITAREIIRGVTGGAGGYGTTNTIKAGGGMTGVKPYNATFGNSFGDQVKANLEANGGQMLASLIIIPVAFKVGSKLTKKPRAIVNKIGKMSGLPVRV